MKKVLIILAALLIAAAASGCAREARRTPKGDDAPPPAETQIPDGASEEQGEKQDSGTGEDVITDRIPDNVMSRIENAIACFTVAPQEFTEVSELRDDTMIYAALLRCAGEFIPAEGDEYTFTLPLERLPSAVKAVFGNDAVLSDSYTSGNYYPFEISVTQGLIYRYSESIEDDYFYTDSVTELEEGVYEVRLLNLRDPLFFDVYEEYLLEGYPPTEEMLAEFRDRMFTYVYTVEDTGRGMIITSFRFLNYKDLNLYDPEME